MSRDGGSTGSSIGSSANWDRSDRIAALLLFVIGCALVFPNLGDRCLWQDDAETALVARNVLKTGLPMGWDGRALVTQMSGQELTDSFLWSWTPWLMHYVAAFGMAVGGDNSFGARWPFGLLGCLSFPIFCRLVRRISGDRFLAIAASLLLLTSVQYLLLMRQCRYYALLPILFFLSLWGYQSLPSRRGVFLLGLGLVLLFHGNFVSCGIVTSGFLIHAALFRRRDPIWKHLIVCGLILLVGSLPWIVATGFLGRASAPGLFKRHLLGTLIMSNRYICPWLLLIGLLVVSSRRRRPRDGILALGLCMIAPMFLFLPRFLWPNPRYVAFLFPVGALIMAEAVREAHAWRSWFGFGLTAMLIASNALVIPLPAVIPAGVGRQLFSGELETGADAVRLGLLKRELHGYLYELTHSCRGPDEELVSWVEANTAPDDFIGVTNDWLPVMYHTGRRITGVITPEARRRPGWGTLPPHLSDITYARWIILRPSHPFGSDPRARAMLLNALARKGIKVERTIHLSFNDLTWINRPILSKHVFRMPAGTPSGVDVLLLSHPQ